MAETQAPVRARRSRDIAPPAAPAPAPEAPARSDEHGALGPVSTERVRKPLGAHRQKLDNSQREGYHRHWFNDDDDGRIQDALAGGYTHVKNTEGQNMTKIVGTKKSGGPLLAYRMEIPLEWYESDQRDKEVARNERLAEMKRGVTPKGAPGEDGRYVPVDAANRPLTKIANGRA